MIPTTNTGHLVYDGLHSLNDVSSIGGRDQPFCSVTFVGKPNLALNP